MQYRQLGESDLQVSAVAFGAWAVGGWMWGGTDDQEAVSAIQRAIDIGMTSIDTAPIYGFGHSEEVVGQAIAGRREKVQVLTKYVLRWDGVEGQPHLETTDGAGQPRTVYRNGRKESVLLECERSLKRLRTDCIDLYQCHWPDETTPIDETMEAIDQLLKEGKIRAAGVSNFSPEQMEAVRKMVPLASNQPPYSMVRRDVEQDVLPYCIENNVGVIVYSPLQRGLLAGKVTMDRVFPANDARSTLPRFQPANRRRVLDFLGKTRPIAEAHGVTLAQLVINWTIHRPGITAALVGARTPAQVEENAAAADFRLSDEEVDRIDSLLGELELEV